MKKIYLLILNILLISTIFYAQTPEAFKYQAVLRNSRGEPLQNKNVAIRISILQNSIDGSVVYSETHELKTNVLGLVNLNVGMGNGTDDFSAIDWAIDKYFIKVEIADERTGGFVEMGTSQLLSVPYALHSKTAEKVFNDEVNDADADPLNEIQTMAVSKTGDTLYLSKSNYLIVPGISKANDDEEETVTDYDGNIYKTVKIGDQFWMAENLKTMHYADGTVITDGMAVGDITGDYTSKYFFNYNNNNELSEVYGRLYTWAAVMNGAVQNNENPSGILGICPIGWHIPSSGEWIELIDYLGGQKLAGGKMKVIGTNYWETPNAGATNESKFSALPAGCRYADGNFSYLGTYTYYWSCTEPEYIEYADTHANYFLLYYQIADAGWYHVDKTFGFSVRCIKD